MVESEAQTMAADRARDGKYLTFALANEEYGLEIRKVREIICYVDITAVPQTPKYVKGVINLRGQVIPVIDLRTKFGMDTAEVTRKTCIIVIETIQNGRKLNTCIVVDSVKEVLNIAKENIGQTPQFDSSVNIDFILGVAMTNKSVKILLDIDAVLCGMNFAGIDNEINKNPINE